MKREPSGRHFDSEDNVIAALNQYLDVQDFYSGGVGVPWGHWVGFLREYVEKML